MNNDPIGKYPLWLEAHKRMRDEGMTYESQWPVEWFEAILKCPRDSQEFVFSIMALRDAIEDEDGYYLRQMESGTLFKIPDAEMHGEICKGFERRLRSFAARAVILRNRTLANPKAVLSDVARKRIEKEAEIAAMRRILLHREKSVIKCVREHKPKLLTDQSEE